MKFKDNTLEFKPSSIVNSLYEPLSVDIKLPKNQEIKHISHYRIGYLFTDKGNRVKTMKVLENAYDLMLITKGAEPKRIFNEHPPTKLLDHLGIPHSEFIPHYNCFGFCFANSLYRITDPSQILEDEYVECQEAEATVIVSFEKESPVHAALRKEGKYIAKSGVKALEEFKTFHEALLGIPFDDFKFYRVLV